MNSPIETNNLFKLYENKEILRDITFSVQEKEIFGIIGPSGSGKSTLLRLIDLIETPTKGTLRIFGEETLGRDSRFHLRRRMAMLSQKPVIFNRSVHDNVAMGMKYRGANRADIDKRVREALDAIGLSAYASRAARTLSGGEAQRVALARAIVTDPEILFLDEPTANLDPLSVETIEEIIVQLNHEHGMTIVLSTHDMLQGQRLSNRMSVIMDGEMLQVGPPREIFHAPATTKIARFVGVENILDGTITGSRGGEVSINAGGT
ncbi:MAG: phosphate ABC transporter ATP-binding protein [Methanomicrobiales archaeon]|nr:phosphate ABC transporter ATP-binding protein [Methanomicrobiales archaeon]